eukprot:scaffold821_cov314-Prasinococcus_capsulatus_cf.AAC.4
MPTTGPDRHTPTAAGSSKQGDGALGISPRGTLPCVRLWLGLARRRRVVRRRRRGVRKDRLLLNCMCTMLEQKATGWPAPQARRPQTVLVAPAEATGLRRGRPTRTGRRREGEAEPRAPPSPAPRARPRSRGRATPPPRHGWVRLGHTPSAPNPSPGAGAARPPPETDQCAPRERASKTDAALHRLTHRQQPTTHHCYWHTPIQTIPPVRCTRAALASTPPHGRTGVPFKKARGSLPLVAQPPPPLSL